MFGATENIILAACLGEGTTVISNAAMEPEILDLQKLLNRMGAKIKGAGTNKIEIQGVKSIKKEVSYNVMPDRIETGTFLCGAAITGGNIIVNKTNPNEIFPVISKLQETGCIIEAKKHQIEIKAPKKLKSVDFKTLPYPGFPTDMQSIFATTLTIAKGTSIIVENIFENRYKYVQELIKMGAKITIEGNIAAIKGVRKLYGTNIKAYDLRGGAAVVIAGLQAKRTTSIENVEYILRGYENLDKKLKSLGADINLIREGG